MKITLCNIIKDDSEYSSWIKMIESARPFVDYVVITANGGKVDKIKAYCEKNGFIYSHLPWKKDYSEQRNYNASLVPQDSDFYLWLDSDDLLVGGEHLRQVAEVCKKKGSHALFLEYWYGCEFNGEPSLENLYDVELHHPRERMLKPGSIEWKMRIHETPVPKEGLDYQYIRVLHTPLKPDKQFPIAVLHTGAERLISNKAMAIRMARNQEMLELELADERKKGQADPRTLLYLLKMYAESDKKEEWNKGISLGEEYLSLSGWDLERAECLMCLAVIAGKMERDDLAVKRLHEAIKEYPFNPMIYLMLSEAYFNLGLYEKSEFYLNQGLSLDVVKGQENKNIIQLKMLATQLLLKFEYQVRRNVDKSLQLAKTLFEIDPSAETKGSMDYLQELKDKNDASRAVVSLTNWLVDTGRRKDVFGLIESLPQAIKELPFAIKLQNKYGTPKKWADNEICYFANFGQTHVEQWSPKNLKKGLGGSETAVIELAKEWTKLGYKVTVYGDPGKEEGFHEGVTYLPWYRFNQRDHFNIFIQWRNNSLAGRVVCKKFLVDLHDVWSPEAYKESIHTINKIMVKSEAHKDLGKGLPDEKFSVIGNGL